MWISVPLPSPEVGSVARMMSGVRPFRGARVDRALARVQRRIVSVQTAGGQGTSGLESSRAASMFSIRGRVAVSSSGRGW